MKKSNFLIFLLFALVSFATSNISFGQLTVTLTNEKDACDGLNNGSIDITVSNSSGAITLFIFGPPNFTFNPSDGDITSLSNLPPRTYLVVAQDDNETVNTGFTIDNIVVPLNISVDAVVDNSSCTIPNGSISITASGGSGVGYSYSWSGPNGYTNNIEDISGLAGGTYTVEVFDDGTNCSEVLVVAPAVNDPSPAVFNITTASPLEVCSGDDAIIQLDGSEDPPGPETVEYTIKVNGVLDNTTTVIGTGAPISLTIASGQFSNGDVLTVEADNANCTEVDMGGSVVIDLQITPLFTGNLDATVCSGDAVGVTLPSLDDDGDVISSYDVSVVVAPGLTGTASTATGTTDVNLISGDIFTNTTSNSLDVVYTVTPYIGTCPGPDFTITVTIDEAPVFTGNLDATVCSGDAIGVTLPSLDDDGDVISSYDVSAVVDPGLGGTASTASGTTDVNLISGDIFTNATGGPLDVVYTITPYIGTCAGPDFTITVTIDEAPVFTGNLDATVCSGDAIGVTLPSLDDDGGVISSYDVSAVVDPGLGGAASTATGTTDVNLISGDIFTNTTSNPLNVVYTVTPYIGTCPGPDFTITVTIDQAPLFTGNLDATVCSDDAIGVILPSLDDDGDVITSYDVSGVVAPGLTGTASTATGTTDVNLISGDIFSNATGPSLDVVYTITPYVGTCPGADFTITVTIVAPPVFTGNLDATVCSGDVIGVSLPSLDDDGDVISSYDVSAVVDPGLGGTASTASGTTDVNLISGDIFTNTTGGPLDVVYTITPYVGTCAGSDFTITVTIDEAPVFTGNLDATVCSGDAIGVTLPSLDDDGGVISSYDVSAVVAP
ncbi:PKD-like domain-containing protein, partial [Fulvivirga imtechensis]|uniref:PKD-like domain-containing protein n=1 Tax=Fulvivirga imtechensis TaxID=881893 RepID=UPI00058FBB4E